MLKTAFLFLFGLMVCQSARAQKPDSVMYYMKDSSTRVTTKDSANYITVIMPADTSRLFPVREYYRDGKLKLSGKALSNKTFVELEGNSTSYYPNGNRKSINNYHNGNLIGDITLYYPNGKLYAIKRYDLPSKRLLLIECHDTSGNVLSENGKGKWLKYNEDFSNINEEGGVKNGLEEDEWYYRIKNDTMKYALFYFRGKLVSPVGDNKELVFAKAQKSPEFLNGKHGAFNKYLTKNIVFPEYDKENNIHGRVIVTFIIEKDGTLSNIIALREPDIFIANEAIRVISLSPPWLPGLQDGKPVRTQFTIAFSF